MLHYRDNFGLKAKALTLMPYMRSELSKRPTRGQRRQAWRACLPEEEEEEEAGAEDMAERGQGFLSTPKWELPTWGLVAQLFVWKRFEDGLTGLFSCAMNLMRGSCEGLNSGERIYLKKNIVYIHPPLGTWYDQIKGKLIFQQHLLNMSEELEKACACELLK